MKDIRFVRGSGAVLFVLGVVTAAASSGCESSASADRRQLDGGTSLRSAGAPTSRATEPLDEARSAHLLRTLNAGEIDLARLATQRTLNTDVRRFAEEMIAAHSAAQQRIDAWVIASHTAPLANPVSADLDSQARDLRTRLETARSTNFDRAYVESQIAMHEAALHLLDERILPGARDERFRPLTEQIRVDVAHHLEMAQTLESQLGR